MKTITLKVLVMAALISAFAMVSFAQDRTEKVQFAAGESDGSWTREIVANGSHDFYFRAKKGQTISYTVGYDFKDSDVEAYLMKTGEQDNYKASGPKENVEYLADTSSEYHLLVRNMSRKKITITLYLSIMNPERSEDSGDAEINTEKLAFSKADVIDVKRNIAAKRSYDFVFPGEEGLTAVVTASAPANSLEVSFCGKTVKLNEPTACKMETGGEWSILVINRGTKTVPMTLNISLEAGNDGPTDDGTSEEDAPGERIQFKKGETSAMITKELGPNGFVDFDLNVRKGQTLEYTVGYDFKDSDIEVALKEPQTPDVSLLGGPKNRNEFKIKKTGDHRISIRNTTKKKVTITLYVDVFN